MIRLRIPQLAAEKGIKHVHAALTEAGISNGVATEYTKKHKDRIEMSHIEKLCLVFRCMPNDLFEIVPDKPDIADMTQPVYTLGPRQDFDLLAKAQNLTPDEIKQLFEELEKKKKQKESGEENKE